MPKTGPRKATQTSDFGAPGRVSHDSTRFYRSRLYEGVAGSNGASPQADAPAENLLPPQAADRLFCKSSQTMSELPDRSVHLMVTSPPYNASKSYDEDLNLDEYLGLLDQVWRETYRTLVPGGRACINVANLGRKPYIPLHAYIIAQMERIGFLMRGEIIWAKGSSAGASTAWGSWRSAANPVLRDTHEYILVFCKDSFRRPKQGRESTIGRDEFLEWTRSVWNFPAISARRVGHPAPFPFELPHRLIQLFTYKGEVVLDPFVGSGTTCTAAASGGRRYVGYDINPEYIALAERRIAATIQALDDPLKK
jgi:site-specific DNA-methyltransferase (adenine-specific)